MESLPKEILIEIFSYLHYTYHYYLKSLFLTCKKFNKIVGETAVLMDKFQLNIDENTKINGSRKYRKVKISTYNLEMFQQLFNNLSGNIVDLTINSENSTAEYIKLNNLLNSTPNLKKLKLYICGCDSDSDYDYDSPSNTISVHSCNDLNLTTLPRLKLKLDVLDIHEKEFCVAFNLLQYCSAKMLKINVSYIEKPAIAAIKNLLKRQTNLEHLVIFEDCQAEIADVFDDDVINADFMLKSLRFHTQKYFSSNLKNFQKFLQHQTSLRKVFISEYSDIGNETETMNILGEIRQIKKLELVMVRDNFNPMRFIETLNICFDLVNGSGFRNLDYLFPNVKDLRIWNDNIKFVEQLTEPEPTNRKEMIITNVKSLALKFINFNNENPFDYANIKVENLKFHGGQNINWLFDYLRTDHAKFKYLELHLTLITRNEQLFLESLTHGSVKKINELKIHVPMKRNSDGDFVNWYRDEQI